jgi:hypothetical protein
VTEHQRQRAGINVCAYALLAVSVLGASDRTARGQALPSQMDDVKFTLDLPGVQPPIKVTRVLLDGRLVAWDSPVVVVGNWVSHIVVEMQNVTSKDLVFGELMLTFPETGSGPSGVGRPVTSSMAQIGRQPSSAFRLKDGTMRKAPAGMLQFPEMRIPPGGVVQFSFAKDEDTLADALRVVDRLHTVKLTPRTFYFADGSKWSGGTFMSPMPPPILWEEAPPDEFFIKTPAAASDARRTGLRPGEQP